MRPQRRHYLPSLVYAAMLLASCGTATVRDASTVPRPIIVQGAMDSEIRKLAGSLRDATEEHVESWLFWKGTIDGYPVIVSKTLKGMSNAAAATVLAAEHFRPIAIINQGTAGGHQSDLNVSDIVVGVESVNLGSFKTGYRALGEGSNFAEWKPLDLLRTDGSAAQDPNAQTIRRFRADGRLIAAARSAIPKYNHGRVIEGVIGSADLWNSELDRIQSLHDQFGTTVEEMETASAAQIAGVFKIPFAGIRVVSNNITNGGAYRSATGEACQEFVLDVVREYIASLSAAARRRPGNGQ